MSTAATTSAFAPPKPTRIPVMPSSTGPTPPGVSGISCSARADADGAQGDEQHHEHRDVAEDRGERQPRPAPPDQIDGGTAEMDEALAPLDHRVAAKRAQHPVERPLTGISDPARERVAPEDEREQHDRDREHARADHRDGRQQGASLLVQREEQHGDDGEQQVRELVPDPRERHRARDVARAEAPHAQEAVRARHPHDPAARRDVGQRRGRLRERQRLPEAETRQRDHPRRGVRDDVDDDRGAEGEQPRRVELLYDGPDVGVARDPRQDDGERDDDDREAERSEHDLLAAPLHGAHPTASPEQGRRAAQHREEEPEWQVIRGDPEPRGRPAADQPLRLPLVDGPAEARPQRFLEVVAGLPLLPRERVQVVHAAEREDELLARDAEFAGGPVRRGEEDDLDPLPRVLRLPGRTRRARVCDGARLERRATERDVAGDERARKHGRDQDRQRLHTLTVLRESTIGTRAASASSAASRNGREKAAVTARSSCATSSSSSPRYSGVSGRSTNAPRTSGTSRSDARTIASTSCATASFSSGGMPLSRTAAAPARSARSSLRSRAVVNTGVNSSSPRTTPACRAAIVQPPCTACGERPWRARSVSAESASPRPAPTRICGSTVHHHADPGSTPSAASPPVTRTTPASARVAVLPIRDATLPVAIAATGITVTTTPATAGSSRQPSTRSKTRRNRAAVSAPESSSSARFAETFGRPAGSTTGRTRSRRTPTRVSRARGAWTKKIDSQPSVSVRIPPMAGPSAAPRIPAAAQVRTALPSEPWISVSRSSAAQTSSAPPTAWTQRAPTSTPNDGARAHARDAAANTSVPAVNAGTGRRRAA